MVDVRDVAALQVDAMTNPAAGGQRCIASEGTYMMAEVGKMLVPAFPDRRVPTAELPNWVVRIVALFDRDVRDNMHEMGTVKHVDGKRGSERLGRPLIGTDVSSIATGKSLIEHGLV